MITEEQIKKALEGVKYPGFTRNIVSFGMVKKIAVQDSTVDLALSLTTSDKTVAEQIRTDIEAALRKVEGLKTINLSINLQNPQQSAQTQARAAGIPGVRHAVAVASGKGGVGKSTVAVNLAVALQRSGAKVGLLDCDIYGPSIPLMMGVHKKPGIVGDKLEPLDHFGIRLMSMGFLIDEDSPVIWRGPMIMKTVHQFSHNVNWGELDYLVIDLPPGTGDTQISLCQTLPLSGAVMVTTPQEVALADVRKAAAMFQRVNVPILGIVENMSTFICPSDQKRYDIFGSGGGRKEAERTGVPFLGEIPITMEIRQGGDQGVPLMIAAPDSIAGKAFAQVAVTLRRRLE